MTTTSGLYRVTLTLQNESIPSTDEAAHLARAALRILLGKVPHHEGDGLGDWLVALPGDYEARLCATGYLRLDAIHTRDNRAWHYALEAELP